MAVDIETLRQAAASDPSLLPRLADTLVAAGRAEEAVKVCRRGLLARPDDVPLRLALGRALSAAGQLEEAQRRSSTLPPGSGAASPSASLRPRSMSLTPRRPAARRRGR
jgi:hypothetical protein